MLIGSSGHVTSRFPRRLRDPLCYIPLRLGIVASLISADHDCYLTTSHASHGHWVLYWFFAYAFLIVSMILRTILAELLSDSWCGLVTCRKKHPNICLAALTFRI